MTTSNYAESIASRIDRFVEKDPNRPVDYWKASNRDMMLQECIDILGIPKENGSEFELLDCGCGTGHLVDVLNKRGYNLEGGSLIEVTGFDLSPEAIKVAENNHPNHNWRVGSFDDNFNFSDKEFDYGLCAGPFCYVQGLNHWELLEHQINQMQKVCKKSVGYVHYTPDPFWKVRGNTVFARFEPKELKKRFPFVDVIIDQQRCEENFGKSFDEKDMYYISF